MTGFWWGLLGSSSLLIGAALVLWRTPSRRLTGLIMAFGAGVLISAVAYDLVEDASRAASGWVLLAGLAAGGLTFFVGDLLIDRRGGRDRKRSTGAQVDGAGGAIALGTVLDGIPESFVLGLTVLTMGEVSVAFLAAVFLSNMPESIAASAGLRENGWSNVRILGLWLLVMIVSGLAAVAGYVLLDHSGDRVVTFVMAFAAGAILTMLADAMMPEAFEKSRLLAGPATTFGFAVAVLLSSIQ